MKPEEYGDKYNDHLIEQYKLYVQMADNISSRRVQANKFYIGLLAALLAILNVVLNNPIICENRDVLIMAASLLGCIISGAWYINVHSYRQLNSGKFKVINEMEKSLPFACYDLEWEILGRGKDRQKYLKLSTIEKYVPAIIAIPYVVLLIYSAYKLLSYRCPSPM